MPECPAGRRRHPLGNTWQSRCAHPPPLKDGGLELPHLVIAVTPDGKAVLRSKVRTDVLRSFGEDLKNVADKLTAPPSPGRYD
jgi:hypothetical protein